MLTKNHIFTNRKILWGLHALAWLTILFIPRFIIHTYGEDQNHFLKPLYFNVIIYGILFYINYLVFVPKLYLNGKKTVYLVVCIVTIILACFLLWFMNERVLFDPDRAKDFRDALDAVNPDRKGLNPPPHQLKILNYIYTSVLVFGFSLGLNLLQKVSRDEKEKKELEKERLNSELAFLKSQVSPHFFFNTLNNIYSLIDINSEDAKESVLKLSKLMRYMLYESEKQKLPLSSEIEFLHHYIDLMKLRISPKVKLDIQLPSDIVNHEIPPLLFIPFVENAFKHGISYRGESFIDIKIDVSDNQILFQTKNSIGGTTNEENKQYSGLGLENTQKRLNLLYPSLHKLDIEKNAEYYSVNLILNIASANE